MDTIFQYGQLKYEYYLEKTDRRSFRLIVYPNLNIHLIAPNDATDNEIETFMKRKWNWLDSKLTEMKKYHKNRYEKQYLAGESFYYLGRQYMLAVERGDDAVKLTRGRIVIFTKQKLNDSDHNKKLFQTWISQSSVRIFNQEYKKVIKDFDLKTPPKLRTREMKTRWGSFQRIGDGIINLNPKLIEAPRDAIRYVILHELCHVNNKNHDDKFYAELFRYMPDWQNVKEKLEVKFG